MRKEKRGKQRSRRCYFKSSGGARTQRQLDDSMRFYGLFFFSSGVAALHLTPPSAEGIREGAGGGRRGDCSSAKMRCGRWRANA